MYHSYIDDSIKMLKTSIVSLFSTALLDQGKKQGKPRKEKNPSNRAEIIFQVEFQGQTFNNKF